MLNWKWLCFVLANLGLVVGYNCSDMMMYNENTSSCVPCRCNPNNTVSCNQTTVECVCRAGFDGPSCDCVTTQHSCNHTVSYCSFHEATPVCVCRPGFYGKQLGCFENLRLIRATGVLEMYHNNKWMSVSYSYGWMERNTKVICRQLGLPTFYGTYKTRTPLLLGLNYSVYSSKSRITEVDCSGDETELSKCRFRINPYTSLDTPFPIIDCRSDCPKFRFGPKCEESDCNQQTSSDCNKTTGQCYCLQGYSGETCDCEDGVHVCNSTYAFCGTPTPKCYCRAQYNRLGLACEDSIRLYGKKTDNEGILQLYTNRIWSTFCDDNFNYKETIVACRQLHLPTRYVTFRTVTDSQNVDSSMAIIYDTDCNGTETGLSECKLIIYGRYCSHREDIYIQCFPNCPNFTFGPNCENPCMCNRNTSMACDEDTGQCFCKTGFFGELCSCKNGLHTCNETISFCDTSYNGTAICLCKPGYSESEYQKEGCLKEQFLRVKTHYPEDVDVVLYQSGVWMRICNYGYSAETARVVCRHFGLPVDYAQLSKNPKGDIENSKSSGLFCNGTEQNLYECKRTQYTFCYQGSTVFTCPKDRLVRLVSIQTTASGTTGLLQIYYKSRWVYLCSSFHAKEAKVACRELGLPTKHVKNYWTNPQSKDISPFFPNCNGEERILAECNFIEKYICEPLQLSCNAVCPPHRFGDNCNRYCPCDTESTASCDMNTGECVCKPGFSGHTCNCAVGSHSCNTTVSDCYYESNQTFCICKAGFTSLEHGCVDNVRISTTNTVEIFEQRWKAICGYTNWKVNNSLVVCRQLNLSTDAIYTRSKSSSGSYYSGKSILCNGTEKTWSECKTRQFTSYCADDRKLMCGKCPEWKYSIDCSKVCHCDKKTSVGCDPVTGACLCHDKYGGTDCSCHTSMISTCKSQYSTCEYDRCKCKQGPLNESTSCSDWNDVVYFCSFSGSNWRNLCDMETNNSRLQHNQGSKYPIWKPEFGSDGTEFVFLSDPPGYIVSISYFAALNFSIESKRSHLCVIFDYVISRRGSIVVSMKDTSMKESIIVSLKGKKTSWTNKRININSSLPVRQIIFLLEVRSAIDQIIITESMCDCADWTFGSSCDDCACVRVHTEFCDKNNGQCHCKQGYTGDACQCDDNGEACPHYIRLVNGNTTSMGRIEVVKNGAWSTVCDEDWDHDDATVVCKQLGLGKYGIAVSNAEFGIGNGPNYIGKIDCQGNETDIMTCSFKKKTCSHYNDAGVICTNLSDSIRLVNGSNKTNGRLEVRIDGRGTWGTVCGLRLSRNSARVACKELGLPTRNVDVDFYGEGSGPIFYVFGCTGNEKSIQLCPKSIRNPTFCSHSSDMGISCSNDCPPFTFGTQCENRCFCNKSKSLSCDKDTGDCVCKKGWTGARCTCRGRTECGENSYCHDDDCLCLDGFFTKPSNCSHEVLVLYSCSFERDFESCSIEKRGLLRWGRYDRRTPSKGTGPRRAMEGYYYIYTEANGYWEGDIGILSLKNLNLKTDACFQFYYHMKGRDMGDLVVIIEDKGGVETVQWSKSGHMNSSWTQARVSLPAETQKIKVIGRRGGGDTSDIALDAFKILQGHCSCEPWRYGLVCEKSCDCRRLSSKSCNSKSGKCVCQPGWSGKTCNCWMSHDNCHSAYSYCHGDRCLCKDGIYSNGVTCSGLNDVTYFCGFDKGDSLEQCNIELRPMQWEIVEDLGQSLDDGYHPENNRYLKTRISVYNRESFFSFSVKYVSVDRESCLHLKYFIEYEGEQMLRIQVVKDNNLLSNILFHGKGWSTAHVPLNASSDMKIYYIAYSYKNSSIMIDDIFITANPCVGCSPWFYGVYCEKFAKCNRSNTISINDKGDCHCKANWFGNRCDCSKEENDACFRDGEECRSGHCTCKDGYIRAETGCIDIDECKFLCDSQTQECINTNGSYTCVCKNGTGDEIICSESSLAVINGTSPQEGTLVMWKQGAWGAFCMEFNLFTAITACNTMFKDIYGASITKRGRYRSTNGVAYTSPTCNRGGSFDFENCNVSYKPCDTEKDALYLNCGVCGGKYTSEFGLVEPPPQLTGNTLCTFLLSPTNAKTITATLIKFSIGSTDEMRSNGCEDTNVEIFDGSNKDAPFLGRFCDNKGNFTINSSGNSLYIVHQTSRDTTKQDFQLIYETEKGERNLSALGKQCAADIQCKANNSSCEDNVCKCRIDFYQWDEASCAKKKAWNSSCYGSNECETEFCDALDKLCICPPNANIDGNNKVCVNITDIIEIPTSSLKYWMVPLLLFAIVFLIIVLAIAIIVVFARRKGYCLKRRDQNTAYTYSELMSASSFLYGMSTDDKSLERGSGISINESTQDEDTGLIEMPQL